MASCAAPRACAVKSVLEMLSGHMSSATHRATSKSLSGQISAATHRSVLQISAATAAKELLARSSTCSASSVLHVRAEQGSYPPSFMGLGLGAASGMILLMSGTTGSEAAPKTPPSDSNDSSPRQDDPDDIKKILKRIEKKLDSLRGDDDKSITCGLMEKAMDENGAMILGKLWNFGEDLSSFISKIIFYGGGVYAMWRLRPSPKQCKDLASKKLDKWKSEMTADLEEALTMEDDGAKVIIVLDKEDLSTFVHAIDKLKSGGAPTDTGKSAEASAPK